MGQVRYIAKDHVNIHIPMDELAYEYELYIDFETVHPLERVMVELELASVMRRITDDYDVDGYANSIANDRPVVVVAIHKINPLGVDIDIIQKIHENGQPTESWTKYVEQNEHLHQEFGTEAMEDLYAESRPIKKPNVAKENRLVLRCDNFETFIELSMRYFDTANDYMLIWDGEWYYLVDANAKSYADDLRSYTPFIDYGRVVKDTDIGNEVKYIYNENALQQAYENFK